MNVSRIEEIEKLIGYTFKDKGYLNLALTHSSYANEVYHNKLLSNERIEFLGDAVLELVSSEFLYKNYPDENEGELTKTRASIVCEPTLNLCAQDINLGKYIQFGKGELVTGGNHRPSIVSDAMESLIGAIYLDGGFTSAKEFIERFILTGIEDKKLFYDSKTILQEIVQGQHLGAIEYVIISESGPDHCKVFESAIKINGKIISKGSGRTKKNAEQEAAYKSILQLRKQNSDH